MALKIFMFIFHVLLVFILFNIGEKLFKDPCMLTERDRFLICIILFLIWLASLLQSSAELLEAIIDWVRRRMGCNLE